jgi:hypothetical protein
MLGHVFIYFRVFALFYSNHFTDIMDCHCSIMLEVEYVIFPVKSHSVSFQHGLPLALAVLVLSCCSSFFFLIYSSCSAAICFVSVNCLHKNYVVHL